MKRFFLLLILFPIALVAANAPPIDDLQGWIDSRVEEGASVLKVPMGIYRLAPGVIAHLDLRGVKNIEIDFQGSELICTDRTRAINLERCENLTLKNVSIDYDPKLYAQGRITAFTPEYFEMEVFEGYPVDDLSSKDAEVYDSETHELKPGFRTFHDLKAVEPIGGRCFRITRKRHLPQDNFVEVGDILLIKTERKRMDGGKYVPHAVYSENCRNMRFENITVYASNCFSFLGQDSSNLHYYRCRVDRRKDDPSVAYPRMRAGNWDAFHSINAEVGPTIEECVAKYMGDDAVNIRGDYHIVVNSEGPTLTVLAKFTLNIQPGDPIEIVTRDGRQIGTATAVARQQLPQLSPEDRQSILSQFTLINPQNCRELWSIMLDREIPVEDGSVICALNRIGSGFKVINNTFGHNRARGILTKANNGLIAGNLIEDTGLESMKLSPNIGNWLEAAYYENLVVTNNTIRNGKIAAHFGREPAAQIRIDGCRTGLVFCDNKIEYNGDTAMIVSDLDGGVIRDNTFSPASGGAVIYENCKNLETK
jgi:hypothetical protein